jgi:hypothetical protein
MSSEETTKTEPAVAVATDKSVDKKALNAGASEWKPNASAQEWTPGVNVAMTPVSVSSMIERDGRDVSDTSPSAIVRSEH